MQMQMRVLMRAVRMVELAAEAEGHVSAIGLAHEYVSETFFVC